MSGFIADVGAIATGSTTYEWIYRQVLHPVGAEPGDWPYSQPCWVFSSRDQPPVPGADIRFVRGPLAPVHAEMTRVIAEQRPDRGGTVWLVGGGDLVGQFFDVGLLDEIVLGVAPAPLGSGAPLLPRRIDPPALTLLEADADGVLAPLRYRVFGTISRVDRAAAERRC